MGCLKIKGRYSLSLSSVSLPLLLDGVLPMQPYPHITGSLLYKDNNHPGHAGLALQPPIQRHSIFVSQARLNHIQIISRLQTRLELALQCTFGRDAEDAVLEAKQQPTLSEQLCLLVRGLHPWGVAFPQRRTLPRDSVHCPQLFQSNSILSAHGLGVSGGSDGG